jgi:hypothetical protein
MLDRITIEPTGTNDTGVCDCCGNSSRCVWGWARADKRCLAAYFIHWTPGHVPDQGAHIDLILGEWGEAATSERRIALTIAYRLSDTGPSMMVIDADGRDISQSSLVGKALRRYEVIGTPLAQEAFAIVDAVLAQDRRIAELLGGREIEG